MLNVFSFIRYRGSFALVLAAGISLGACGQPGGTGDVDDYASFQTAVASAGEDGYTPYWLGESFTAGGLEYRAGHGTIGTTVEGGGSNSLTARP